MDRRRFIKLCGTTAAMASLPSAYLDAARAGEVKTYGRVKLVDGQGNPIRAKQLGTQGAYIFNYPYKGTPCFLVNLSSKPAGNVTLTADNGDYVWPGGVGPAGTVVAFTAICAHQLSYPTREHTPIDYYASEKSEVADKAGVFVCCEHDRVYDPAQGGRMTAANKKATQPLATILLEHVSATDELFAVGVIGGARFDDFFKSFKRELLEAYGAGVARQEVADVAEVLPIAEYTKTRDQC